MNGMLEVEDAGRVEAARLLQPIWRRLFAIWFVLTGLIYVFADPDGWDYLRGFIMSLGVLNIILAGGVIYAYNKVQNIIPREAEKASVAKLLPRHIFFIGISHIGMTMGLIGNMIELWGEPLSWLVLPVATFAFLSATFGLTLMWVYQMAKENRIVIGKNGIEEAHPKRRRSDLGL